MTTYRYVVLPGEDGRITLSAPDVPGVHTTTRADDLETHERIVRESISRVTGVPEREITLDRY
jgi:hypothetical protein